MCNVFFSYDHRPLSQHDKKIESCYRMQVNESNSSSPASSSVYYAYRSDLFSLFFMTLHNHNTTIRSTQLPTTLVRMRNRDQQNNTLWYDQYREACVANSPGPVILLTSCRLQSAAWCSICRGEQVARGTLRTCTAEVRHAFTHPQVNARSHPRDNQLQIKGCFLTVRAVTATTCTHL